MSVPKHVAVCERVLTFSGRSVISSCFRVPHHTHRRPNHPASRTRWSPPKASLSFRSSHHHRPAGLLFEHAADALDNGRFTEAAAILEEALVAPSYASSRVPLPPHWSLLQLQTNLVECLLHAKQYSRAVTLARHLRTTGAVPRHAWSKLLWLESIALARAGLHDAARDVYCSAFLSSNAVPCVPHAHQEAMHVSLLIALGVVDTDVPTPPDMHRVGTACDPAYPFVTVCDDCVLLLDNHVDVEVDARVFCMLRMAS